MTTIAVKDEWKTKALLSNEDYEAWYAKSIAEPDAFWGDQAKRLDWMTPFTKVKNASFAPGAVSIKWFEDGALNVSANCLDRHLATRGDQTAILFEGDDPSDSRAITYAQVHEETCRMANVLKARGVEKGDRVTIYLPMIPEAAYAMLACARIGAVHSVVFGGFSPDALGGRLEGAGSSVLITADEGRRGGKTVPLKKNADKAIEIARKAGQEVSTVLVVKRTGGEVAVDAARDIWWHEARETVSADCPPEAMGAEDPLFILYTSGSTGKPKGVLHTSGGYLVYAAMTHQYVFDYRDGDVYWCTADVGWVTGHSYIVYGPLANGATTFMFEGIPTYPDAGRYWDMVQRHKITTFYTAPTAIRAVAREGNDHPAKYDRSSLRVLGSVGEPINP
ncbi:MAG: AMP-binding protein, partial [Rhizobiaceae bacterium]|nr:AMP-binding protein [Rhizobiaceae bacterium]